MHSTCCVKYCAFAGHTCCHKSSAVYLANGLRRRHVPFSQCSSAQSSNEQNRYLTDVGCGRHTLRTVVTASESSIQANKGLSRSMKSFLLMTTTWTRPSATQSALRSLPAPGHQPFECSGLYISVACTSTSTIKNIKLPNPAGVLHCCPVLEHQYLF